MFILHFNILAILFCCTFLLLNGHFSCKNMEQLQATEKNVTFSIITLEAKCTLSESAGLLIQTGSKSIHQAFVDPTLKEEKFHILLMHRRIMTSVQNTSRL